LCSQAGVIYQWQATNGETPYGITLALEFDGMCVPATKGRAPCSTSARAAA